MSIWFDRPNAAFHAYERSLLRPIARPAPRDTPSLWQRAKEMFGVMMERASTVMQCITRLTRTERREIINRLKPVEKLTRALLVSEAATLLLMTPEGMKLRREARIMTLPVKTPPPPKGALITGSRELVIRGLYIPPAPPPAIKPAPVKPDANDPSTWRCTFNVIRLVMPEDDTAPPAKKSGPRPRAFSYEDIVSFTPAPPRQPGVAHDGNAIARRIEALSRVLAKPDRAIRRVARFFASLPREALDPPYPVWINTRGWYHGHNEARAAYDIRERAETVYYRLRRTDFDGPVPEPG